MTHHLGAQLVIPDAAKAVDVAGYGRAMVKLVKPSVIRQRKKALLRDGRVQLVFAHFEVDPPGFEKVIEPDPGRLEVKCAGRDRKSTRLNSSHLGISYA